MHNFPRFFLHKANHILTKCYADMQEITKGIDHVQDSVKLVEKCKTGFCPPSEILKDEDPLAKQKTQAVKHGKGGMRSKSQTANMLQKKKKNEPSPDFCTQVLNDL